MFSLRRCSLIASSSFTRSVSHRYIDGFYFFCFQHSTASKQLFPGGNFLGFPGGKFCVFRPANRCFASRLLVKIIFFQHCHIFSSQNKEKNRFCAVNKFVKQVVSSFHLVQIGRFFYRQVFTRSQPAFGCLPLLRSGTLMLVDHLFNVFFTFLVHFFFLFFVCDRKRCENAGKEDFEQLTMCKAPVRWTKYTTGKDPKMIL